jgi:hypothetical protein
MIHAYYMHLRQPAYFDISTAAHPAEHGAQTQIKSNAVKRKRGDDQWISLSCDINIHEKQKKSTPRREGRTISSLTLHAMQDEVNSAK